MKIKGRKVNLEPEGDKKTLVFDLEDPASRGFSQLFALIYNAAACAFASHHT